VLNKIIIGGIIIGVIIIAVLGYSIVAEETEIINIEEELSNEEVNTPKKVTIDISDGLTFGEP
jgi:hypothetical protein